MLAKASPTDPFAVLDDRGVQEVLRVVDTRDLVVALKTAPEEVAACIFRNLSERARENLQEEIEFLRCPQAGRPRRPEAHHRPRPWPRGLRHDPDRQEVAPGPDGHDQHADLRRGPRGVPVRQHHHLHGHGGAVHVLVDGAGGDQPCPMNSFERVGMSKLLPL